MSVRARICALVFVRTFIETEADTPALGDVIWRFVGLVAASDEARDDKNADAPAPALFKVTLIIALTIMPVGTEARVMVLADVPTVAGF